MILTIIKIAIQRLFALKARAISLIEIAISLSIIGIITSMMLNVFHFFQHKQHEAEIKYHLHEISVAAARYAADHGYLPLPDTKDDQDDCNQLNDPSDYDKNKSELKGDVPWVKKSELKGDVPWVKLGLKSEPIVNGKKFTWVVAVTAIKRKGWKYYPSK